MYSCEFCELFEDLRTDCSGTSVRGSLFIKVASLKICRSFLAVLETVAQVFSCEFCEIFGNVFLPSTSQEPRLTWCSFFSILLISDVCSLKSVYLVELWYLRRNNSQARSILCSYRNQVETSLSSCGITCTDFGIGNEIKGRTEKLVKEG